jgi:hypothetical protein
MKKYAIILFIWFIFSQLSFSQVGFNNDNSAPHPSAQLDVKSSNKGLLLPRVISPSTAVATPAAGLVVYDQANANLTYYNGAQWSHLNGSAGNTGLYSRFPNSIGYKGEIGSLNSNLQYSFTVPPNITQIWIEAWGGGDSGTNIPTESTTSDAITGFSGGDAGDFGSFLMAVTPGEIITIRVGRGATGNNGAGGSTQVVSNTAPTRTYTIGNQLPGIAFVIGSTAVTEIPGLIQFVAGEKGNRSEMSFAQTSSTEFRRISTNGKGGDAYPNQKGGSGISLSWNIATGNILLGNLISIAGKPGATPGAGGGVSLGTSGAGGAGQVILHW